MEDDSEHTPIGLVATLLGLTLQPAETSRRLLSQAYPPHVLALFLCLMLTFLAPVGIQLIKFKALFYRPDVLFALLAVVCLTLLLFILFETCLLLFSSLPVTFPLVGAIVVYSITPLILVTWLVYLFNYLATGSLTLVNLLLTGVHYSSDPFIKILPYVFLIAHLVVLVVFISCIRVVGQMGVVTAAAMSCLSLLPLYGAFYLALLVSDTFLPGSMKLFFEIMARPSSLTFY